jgi:hypothetical protein
MSDEIRGVTEAGIRHRHPAYSEDDIRAALAVIILGPGETTHQRARRISPGG